MFKVISLRSITLLWFGIASKLVLLSLCATVIVYCLLFIIFRSLQLFEEGADEGDVVIVIGEAASLAGVGGTVVAAEGTAEGVDEVSAIGAPTCAGTGNAIPKDNATIIRSLFIPRWCLQSFQVDIHITGIRLHQRIPSSVSFWICITPGIPGSSSVSRCWNIIRVSQ